MGSLENFGRLSETRRSRRVRLPGFESDYAPLELPTGTSHPGRAPTLKFACRIRSHSLILTITLASLNFAHSLPLHFFAFASLQAEADHGSWAAQLAFPALLLRFCDSVTEIGGTYRCLPAAPHLHYRLNVIKSMYVMHGCTQHKHYTVRDICV